MNKSEKIYVAIKPCKKPIIELQWNGYGGKNPEYINVTDSIGLNYFEDEHGYYIIHGGIRIRL
jgi:hypothetical protein